MRRRAAAVVALAAAALACGRGGPPTDGDDLAARLERATASVVVVAIDATAAAHVAAYGYARETTPRIDALAERAVVFERAYAQAPSTSPSVTSYLTGLYPHALAERLAAGTSDENLYLPEAFARAGFRTAGFSGNPIVEIAIPGDAVFETFVGSARREKVKAVPVPSRRVVRRALEWIDSLGADERFFLYVHLLPPHGPYTPPPEHARFRPEGYDGDLVPDAWLLHRVDRGRVELTPEEHAFVVSQYDGNLHFADALVGQLLDGLDARRRLERSVVVVLSDHGEAFGQHGRWVHNSTLYDEMIRVPWIFSLPAAAGVPPRRVRTPVALVDLAPTLVDLFGLDPALARQGQGASLLPFFTAEDDAAAERAIFSQNPESVAAIRGDYKLILSQRGGVLAQELYRLADDPAEARDLADARADLVAELRDEIGGFLDAGVEELSVEAAAASLSEESERQLNALGYLIPDRTTDGPPDEPRD